jgi:hypothetical protein
MNEKALPETVSLRKVITKMAARAQGVCSSEITQFDRKDVARNLWRMADGKAIFRGGHGKTIRFYTDPKRAEEFTRSLEHKQERKPKPKQAKEVGVSIKHYGRAPWTADTPADYSKAKVTICPSPPEFGLAAKLRSL